MSNITHYIALPASRLGHKAVAVRLVEGSEEIFTEVAVDEDQMSPRLVAALGTVSTLIVGDLKARAVPLDRPWGPVKIELHDEPVPDRLDWIVPRVTPGGIVVPLPRQLLTVDVARGLEVLGTETMRWYDPPETGR